MSAPEFDGQPMTKREVLVARNAFEMGLSVAATEFARMISRPAAVRFRDIMDLNWPLQKVTRGRSVADPHCPSTWWFVRHGALVVRHGDTDRAWNVHNPDEGYRPTPERVALWADLLARPTEEADA